MLEYIFGSLDKSYNIYFYIISTSVVIIFILFCLFLFCYPYILKKREFTYYIIFIVLLFIMVFFQNKMLYNMFENKIVKSTEGYGSCSSTPSMLTSLIDSKNPGSSNGGSSNDGSSNGGSSNGGSLNNIVVGPGNLGSATYMSTEDAYKYISNYLDEILKNTKPLQYITDTNRINTK